MITQCVVCDRSGVTECSPKSGHDKCHHQTNFQTLINLEVQNEQKNNSGYKKGHALMCKKGHTLMRLLIIILLVEGMLYHTKSLYIVFKMHHHLY